MPSFVHTLDATIEVAGLGEVKLDVAYGGMFFAIVDAGSLGLELVPSEARRISEFGERIRLAAREQLDIVHPDNPDVRGVTIVQFDEPFRGVGEVSRNNCVVAPGRLDRSPTGTGTSARLALLHARGERGLRFEQEDNHDLYGCAVELIEPLEDNTLVQQASLEDQRVHDCSQRFHFEF